MLLLFTDVCCMFRFMFGKEGGERKEGDRREGERRQERGRAQDVWWRGRWRR